MKELYEAPMVQVMEMELQGMIAVSGGPYDAPTYGDKEL